MAREFDDVSRRLELALIAAGERVVRVAPALMGQSRQGERQPGTSDQIDALAVARAVVREGVERTESRLGANPGGGRRQANGTRWTSGTLAVARARREPWGRRRRQPESTPRQAGEELGGAYRPVERSGRR